MRSFSSSQDEAMPTLESVGSSAAGMIRRWAAILLAFALLGALWSTALSRVSEKQPAINLLNDVGTDIINPVLLANGSGIAQSQYQQLEQAAVAHPNQPVQIPFLKITIPGSAIAGKDATTGMRVIYAHVAEIYYDQGPNAVFTLPPALQSFVSSYNPLVASAQAQQAGVPALPIPQLPAFAAPLYTAVGITPMTLTAAGHTLSATQSLWFWIASAVLALMLILMSTGWKRLWSVAWPLFHASWTIALIGVIVAVIASRNLPQLATYKNVIDLLEGTFMPVFYVATIVGIVAIAVSLVGERLTRTTATATATASGSPNSASFTTPAASEARNLSPRESSLQPEPSPLVTEYRQPTSDATAQPSGANTTRGETNA